MIGPNWMTAALWILGCLAAGLAIAVARLRGEWHEAQARAESLRQSRDWWRDRARENLAGLEAAARRERSEHEAGARVAADLGRLRCGLRALLDGAPGAAATPAVTVADDDGEID